MTAPGGVPGFHARTAPVPGPGRGRRGSRRSGTGAGGAARTGLRAGSVPLGSIVVATLVALTVGLNACGPSSNSGSSSAPSGGAGSSHSAPATSTPALPGAADHTASTGYATVLSNARADLRTFEEMYPIDLPYGDRSPTTFNSTQALVDAGASRSLIQALNEDNVDGINGTQALEVAGNLFDSAEAARDDRESNVRLQYAVWVATAGRVALVASSGGPAQLPGFSLNPSDEILANRQRLLEQAAEKAGINLDVSNPDAVISTADAIALSRVLITGDGYRLPDISNSVANYAATLYGDAFARDLLLGLPYEVARA